MAKQCWSQTVLESGSWGHSVLQTPALVFYEKEKKDRKILWKLSSSDTKLLMQEVNK